MPFLSLYEQHSGPWMACTACSINWRLWNTCMNQPTDERREISKGCKGSFLGEGKVGLGRAEEREFW